MLRVKPLRISRRLGELVVTPVSAMAGFLRRFDERVRDGIYTLRSPTNDRADDEEVAGSGVALSAFLSGLVDECYEAVAL